jgi:hypothetical protein
VLPRGGARLDLYDRMPLVYRELDVAQGDPLRALLQAVDVAMSQVHADVGDAYERLFVETCPTDLLARVASVVRADPAPGGTWRRAAVAATLHLRRRKGTLAALQQALAVASGWWVAAQSPAGHLLTTDLEGPGGELPAPDEPGPLLDHPATAADAEEPDPERVSALERGSSAHVETVRASIRRRISLPRIGGVPAAIGEGRYRVDPGGRPRALFTSTLYGDGPAPLDAVTVAADLAAARADRRAGREPRSRFYGPAGAFQILENGVPVGAERIRISAVERPPPVVRVRLGRPRVGPFPGGWLTLDADGKTVHLSESPDGPALAAALEVALEDAGVAVRVLWDGHLVLVPANGQGEPPTVSSGADSPDLADAIGLGGVPSRWALLGTPPLLPAGPSEVAWPDSVVVNVGAAGDLPDLAGRLEEALRAVDPPAGPPTRVLVVGGADWPRTAGQPRGGPGEGALLVLPARDEPLVLVGSADDTGAAVRLGLDGRIVVDVGTGTLTWPAGLPPLGPLLVDHCLGVYALGPDVPGRRPRPGLPHVRAGEGPIVSSATVTGSGVISIGTEVSGVLRIEADAGAVPVVAESVQVAGEGELVLRGLLLLRGIVAGPGVSVRLEDCEVRGAVVAGARVVAHRCRLDRLVVGGVGPVELSDCLLAVAGGEMAIAGPSGSPSGSPSASPSGSPAGPAPATHLRAVTALGPLHVTTLDASDCIFAGRIGVARPYLGALDHCLHVGGELPDTRRGDVQVAALAPAWFISLDHANPACAVIRPSAPRLIRLGAADGGERGAFHSLGNPDRQLSLAEAAAMYTRAGWRTLLHFED